MKMVKFKLRNFLQVYLCTKINKKMLDFVCVYECPQITVNTYNNKDSAIGIRFCITSLLQTPPHVLRG